MSEDHPPETPFERWSYLKSLCGVQPREWGFVLFGRMNPPTRGHMAAVNTLVRDAQAFGATPVLFLSPSYDDRRGPKNKNPLAFPEKCLLVEEALRQSVPGLKVVANNPRHALFTRTIGNPFIMLSELSGRFHNVRLYGDGAITQVDWDKYNKGRYWFRRVEVASSGRRGEDLPGVEGISATKVRGFVASGDRESFDAAIAPGVGDLLWPLLRERLGQESQG